MELEQMERTINNDKSSRVLFTNEDASGHTTIFADDLYDPDDEAKIKKLVAQYNETCATVDSHDKRKRKLFALIKEMSLVTVFGSKAFKKHEGTGHWIVLDKYVVYKIEHKWKILKEAWPNKKVKVYNYRKTVDLRDRYFSEEFDRYRGLLGDKCCNCGENCREDDIVVVKIWKDQGELLKSPKDDSICSACFIDYETEYHKDFESYPPRFNQIKTWGWSKHSQHSFQQALDEFYAKSYKKALMYNG